MGKLIKGDMMGKLLETLSKAQLEFKPIKKTGKNPFLHNDYATLDDIVNATKDGLSNNGLSIIHRKDKGSSEFITELWHFEEEEPMATYTDMEQFTKTSEKTSLIQIYGGIITYLRRYHTGMLLNLCVEEDTDGNDGKSGGKATTQGKPATTATPVTQAKVDPPPEIKAGDGKYKTTDDYITRINGGTLGEKDEPINTLAALKGWQKKHQPEINKMSTDVRMSIMAVFQERLDVLKKAESIPQDDPSLIPLGDGEDEHRPGL